MTYFILGAAPFVIVAGLLLSCRYRWFIQQMEKIETANYKRMLNDSVSYKKYKAISARTSIRNSPVRETGDFLDFFLSFTAQATPDAIEGKLAAMDCGEIYE